MDEGSYKILGEPRRAKTRVWRFLGNHESDEAGTSRFVDLKIALHTIVSEYSALAFVLLEILGELSRSSRKNWGHTRAL
jgi:hypothetical protein